MIEYRQSGRPPTEEAIALYRAKTLAERRPVDDSERMDRMLRSANVLIAVYDEDRLVGLSRAMSDFGWVCYVADLLVDQKWQGQGIGRELLRLTHEVAGGEDGITLILVAAPEAMSYYPKIGFEPIPEGWRRQRGRNRGSVLQP